MLTLKTKSHWGKEIHWLNLKTELGTRYTQQIAADLRNNLDDLVRIKFAGSDEPHFCRQKDKYSLFLGQNGDSQETILMIIWPKTERPRGEQGVEPVAIDCEPLETIINTSIRALKKAGMKPKIVTGKLLYEGVDMLVESSHLKSEWWHILSHKKVEAALQALAFVLMLVGGLTTLNEVKKETEVVLSLVAVGVGLLVLVGDLVYNFIAGKTFELKVII